MDRCNIGASEAASDNGSGGSPSSMETNKGAPQVFRGYINRETVKGVNFFGPKCEYVVSGSDCGRIFIWKKKGGQLIRVMEGDKVIVNCIEFHPYMLVLANSGIDNDIKIWTPKALEKATLPTKLEQKPKAIGWLYHVKPELFLQLFSSRRQSAIPDGGGENSDGDREPLELMLTFNANSYDSSDNGRDTISQDDLFSWKSPRQPSSLRKFDNGCICTLHMD